MVYCSKVPRDMSGPEVGWCVLEDEHVGQCMDADGHEFKGEYSEVLESGDYLPDYW